MKAGHATSKKVRPLPGGNAEVRAATGSGPSSPAGVIRQRRERAGHVVIGGRGGVAGDGRVVDHGSAAGQKVEPTADSDAGDTGGTGAAGEGGACAAARGSAGSGDRACREPTGASRALGWPGCP